MQAPPAQLFLIDYVIIGLYLVMEKLFPLIGSPEKFELGLEAAREYVHSVGLTAASDPGVNVPE